MNASKLSEQVKFDVALESTELDTASATGEYYNLQEFDRACFVIEANDIADGDTLVAAVQEAEDNDGTGAGALTGATCTITGGAGASKVQVTAATVVDGDTLTISGTDKNGAAFSQVFTAEDTSPDATAGEFDTGSTDTDAMANLAAVVNTLLAGKVDAAAASGVLTLTSEEPGEVTITAVPSDSTLLVVDLKSVAFIEFDAEDLSGDNTHVAIKLTSDADNQFASATLLRYGSRYTPRQRVAASASL